MQNREFQKILKKQQRQINLRHRITSPSPDPLGGHLAKDETSDEEEEAIYETLSALATVHHHRLGHSHSVIPKATSECSNDEDDYVTLVCHEDDDDDDEDDVEDDDDEVTSPPPPSEGPAEGNNPVGGRCTPTAPPRARLKRGSKSEEKQAAVTRQDSLQSIWERLRRSQRGKAVPPAVPDRPSELQRLACSVRRAASFSSQHSNSHFYVDCPVPVQPISPAVWLKQQGPHLVTSGNKAGSLPRSFQVSHELKTAHKQATGNP